MKNFRVGAYLRVSKDDGKDINSNSIENQKEIIEQYIKKQSNMKYQKKNLKKFKS